MKLFQQETFRYVAEDVAQVWEAIAWLRNDPERDFFAIVCETRSDTNRMKLFRVIYEYPGETLRKAGVTSTEIKQETFRYVAEDVAQVWEAIAWLRNDPERDFFAIVCDGPCFAVLPSEAIQAE